MEINKRTIRETLEKRFKDLEIRELAETLNISYIEIEGGGLKKEIFELVEYSEKHGLMETLWNYIVKVRPDVLHNMPLETIEDAIAEYLKKTSSAENVVDLVGFASNFRMKIEFDEIYVSLSMSNPVHLSPIVANLDEYFVKTDQISDIEFITSESKNTIVFGPLGCGKTKLLDHIKRETAKRSLEMGSKELPVYIDFLSYSTSQISSTHLQQLIEKTFSETLGLNINFATLIRVGWTIKFLFNHLDDLPDNLHRLVSSEIEKVLASLLNCTAIISYRNGESAPQFFDTTKNFQVIKILPLSKDQILELTHRLYDSIRSNASGMSISLKDLQELIISPELIQWLHTPLEVVIGVSCVVSSRILRPDAIATIIKKKILTMQLYEWNQQKSQVAGQFHDNLISFMDTIFFMAYRAYGSVETDFSLVVPVEAGAQYIYEMGISQSPERARRELLEALSRINSTTELLEVPDLEYSTNYKFRNKNIIEVLAATHLVSMPAEVRNRILTARFEQKNWRTLFPLLFDILLYQSVSDAEEYLNLMLGDVPNKEKLSQIDADRILLASSCVSRGKFHTGFMIDKITNTIIKILGDKDQIVSLKTRILLAEYLGEFGDSRTGITITVAEGPFWRGYDPFPNDRPVRQIYLNSYVIDAYPVTNKQYQNFIEDNGYIRKELWDSDGWGWVQGTKRETPKYWHDPRFNKPNYPVVGVSWFEADAYARWAGKRLPTESEWEKAARGPIRDENDKTKYYWPWGNAFNGAYLNCNESLELIHGTTPVGIYPAGQSPYGIFDMAGNVSEWVSDWYEAYDGNPIKDSHYEKRFKVRRGGGWGWDSDFTRCTCRNASPRDADYAVNGFRCCDI
jgi:formylglycine-generating enzyme required for sulfatase activity